MPHTDKGLVALTVTHLGCVSGSPAAPQGLAPTAWDASGRRMAQPSQKWGFNSRRAVQHGRRASPLGVRAAAGLRLQPGLCCEDAAPLTLGVGTYFLVLHGQKKDKLQDHGRTNDPTPKAFHIAFLALSTYIFFQTGFFKKRNMNSGNLRKKKLAQPFSYTGNSPRTQNTKTYYREGKLFH